MYSYTHSINHNVNFNIIWEKICVYYKYFFCFVIVLSRAEILSYISEESYRNKSIEYQLK